MPSGEMVAIDLAPAKGIAFGMALGILLYLNFAVALWEGLKLL